MSEAHQKGSFALSAIGAQIGKHGRQKKKKKKKTPHSEFHVHHLQESNPIKIWWFYWTFFLNPKHKELQVLSASKTIFKSEKVQSSVLEGFT